MFDFLYDPRRVWLVPVVAVSTVECDNPDCEGTHGLALEIGWLFWVVRVGVLFPD